MTHSIIVNGESITVKQLKTNFKSLITQQDFHSTNVKYNIYNYLVTKYPSYFKAAFKSEIIMALGDTPIEFLIDKIDEAKRYLGVKGQKCITYGPRSAWNTKVKGIPGSLSSTYDSVLVQAGGMKYFIKYNVGYKNKKIDNNSREALFTVLCNMPMMLNPIGKSITNKNRNEYYDIIRCILRFLRYSENTGLSKSAEFSLILYLEAEMNERNVKNSTVSLAISNAISGANLMSTTGYTDLFTMYMIDEYLDRIRKMNARLKKISKLDNGLPIDVIGIRKGHEKDVKKLLDEIDSITDTDTAIKAFDSMFYLPSDAGTHDRMLFGISLKQELSRAGKSKFIVGAGGNIVADDLDGDLTMKIRDVRLELQGLQTKKLRYKLYGIPEGFTNVEKQQHKYSALRLLLYLVKQYAKDETIIEKQATSCAGAGLNANFIKIIMSANGNWKMAETEEFPEYTSMILDPHHEIEIVDKDTAGHVDMYFKILYNGHQRNVRFEFRRGTTNSIQSSIELVYEKIPLSNI